MSMEAVVVVWDLDVQPDQKLVLLALADNYGFETFTLDSRTIQFVAEKTRFSESEVTEALQRLIAANYLMRKGGDDISLERLR